MARNFNLRAQLANCSENIQTELERLRVFGKNDNLLSEDKMSALISNIKTVNIGDEIVKADVTIELMKTTTNLLKLEEKRRRLNAQVLTHL